MRPVTSYGVTFNGKHSSTFGAYVADTKIVGMPAKNKVTVLPPGSNRVIDLSALYGQTYAERTLQMTFVLTDTDTWTKEVMYRGWTKLINWLMGPVGKVPLIDDIMSDYYYLAEVQEAPSLAEAMASGQLTVTFTCYPFRIKRTAEFDDIWDTFDFDDDIAQITKYVIGTNGQGTLINTGLAEVPLTIECTKALTLTLNEEDYSLDQGSNTGTELVLVPGDNQISISGDAGATATFEWHREVI
ncbi:phage tail domain-containing protein [Lacticaseibacillus hulanensis]|uniref:phage tail domain-containing protein n=1 Tax=Lacticaseibacillus hulanensis TaxID=2493111 RepID=UPI000FD9D9FD|nr:phage tail domain-containing protein [Lacticaseibacillus hulanensis]